MAPTKPLTIIFSVQLLVVYMNVIASDKYMTTTSIPFSAPMSWECEKYSNLEMETAQLQYNMINMDIPLYIYGASDNCYHCLYLPLSHTPLHSNSTYSNHICIIIDTHHPYSIGFSPIKPFTGCNSTNQTCPWQPNSTDYIIQPTSYHYHEYFHYKITINGTNSIIQTTKSASNKYIPLYIAISSIFAIIICYNIYLYLQEYDENKHDENEDDDNNKQKMKKIFVSLDAVRGMSLLIMIFVNYGGGGYWWLNHSTWNGLTVADLVFPWFIWIMGVAMAITFPRYLSKYSKQYIAKKVIIRAIKLFLIAYISCNNAYYLQYIRIMGVLQYFVIAYTFNGLLLVLTEPSKIPQASKTNLYIPEIITYRYQWLFVLLILLTNLFIVYELPVTIYGMQCPKRYIGPGGIGDYGQYMECTGGAHRYIDYKLFGHKHVYQHPTVKQYYATGWYEAESFIGSFTVILLCYLGIYSGRILIIYKSHQQRILRWMINCIGLGLIAGILCGFKQNGGSIPVNKNLWSLSFVCCQASLGLFLLVIFYIFIDVKGIWSGLPFHWLGSNSIIIYVGSEIFGKYFPFGFEYGDKNHYKVLLSNIIGISVWIYIAAYLYYKNVRFSL